MSIADRQGHHGDRAGPGLRCISAGSKTDNYGINYHDASRSSGALARAARRRHERPMSPAFVGRRQSRADQNDSTSPKRAGNLLFAPTQPGWPPNTMQLMLRELLATALGWSPTAKRARCLRTISSALAATAARRSGSRLVPCKRLDRSLAVIDGDDAGAAQACRAASSFAAQERSFPVSVTLLPSIQP